MSPVLFIHYAVASTMANRIAALAVRGEEEALRAAVADAANWIFWPSLAAGAAIRLGGKTMLWLFNPQFQQAYPVMVILAIGLLARAALGPADAALNMLGHGAASALLLLASALLSVALSAALVPAFGLGGAATAIEEPGARRATRERRRRLGDPCVIARWCRGASPIRRRPAASGCEP
jgi:O-antigen/teichoic acid export membrane protein